MKPSPTLTDVRARRKPLAWIRLAAISVLAALLSACATQAPQGVSSVQGGVQVTGPASEPIHIQGYGTLQIQHTSAARLQVSVPERQLALLLDPEVTQARLARPIVEDDYTLLPLHIKTATCANRMAVYVLKGNTVESFDYLGMDCNRQIVDQSSDTVWRMSQQTSAGTRHTWGFDGRRLTRSVVQPRPAAGPTRSQGRQAVAPAQPVAPRVPAAAPAPSDEPLFIDLL
ncbi:MAG: hypothetical protein GX772_11845 [Alcaligenaceae bacterium]|nr:hypothetical protein [Alcaligenaceae bacterium]